MNSSALKITLLTAIFILFDQLSKLAVLKFLTQPFYIIKGIAQFKYSENYGIAFSIAIPFPLLIAATIILLFTLTFFASREVDLNKKLSQLSLALILAGGLSNLIDRLVHGFVIDFISIGPWPIFNIADIFITIGVLLFLAFHGKISRNQKPKNARKSKRKS